MFLLIAEGAHPRQRWKNPLAEKSQFIVGRDVNADFPVLWDRKLSRRHVRLTVADDHLRLEKLPEAKNAVFYQGRPVENCTLSDGDHFVVGSTCFRVIAQTRDDSSSGLLPQEEVTFDRRELKKVPYRDADRRIDVLAHLPDVIWSARSENEFYHLLLDLALAGVTHAEAVAAVAVDATGKMNVIQWVRRQETAGDFKPSHRLVEEALRKKNQSVLHVWEASDRSPEDYTRAIGSDWAFCTPVTVSGSECWGLYVAGRMTQSFIGGDTILSEELQLQADVKFTELLAAIVSSVRRLNRLERQQAGFRQFFAPPILAALGDDWNPDLLEPRICDVTVMFCDLRGFSLQAEESADDLHGLLDRVSSALGVMTQQILLHRGVTGDFQGDAALGFWGWPFASVDSALDACRAALAIQREFAEIHRRPEHPLADFEMGIGIAHGRAIAGKIGTSDQVKVTVFGPVVNLAHRLESLTKQLRVPILLDERTATFVRDQLAAHEGRTRRLARILPYGMETPLFVSELLPSESESSPLTDWHLQRYEAGLEHFLQGRWDEAYHCLHDMPADDRAQDFLSMMIAQHNRHAPADWDGIVRMPSK